MNKATEQPKQVLDEYWSEHDFLIKERESLIEHVKLLQ